MIIYQFLKKQLNDKNKHSKMNNKKLLNHKSKMILTSIGAWLFTNNFYLVGT